MIQWWNNRPPTIKRTVVVGAVVTAAMSAMTFIPNGKKGETALEKRHRNLSENVLTDSNTRSVGLDALAERQRGVESKLDKVEKQLAHLMSRSGVVEPDDLSRQIAEVRAEIKKASDQSKQAADLAEKAAAATKAKPEQQPSVRADEKPENRHPEKPGNRHPEKASERPETRLARGEPEKSLPAVPPAIPFDPAKPETLFSMGAPQETGQGGGPAKDDKKLGGSGSIRTIAEETGDRKDPKQDRNANNTAFYLPAGSIISGVLLTGMDAPTGQHAQKNPFPALLRIKHDAVLPNRFRADVRECFVLVGGYGDLGSERALLRGETLSCVRKDGRIVEADFPAYATGEDGKAGVRGRVVSKQGAMVANAMISGLMEGVSEAFNTQAVPIISTSTTDAYTTNLNASALQGAAVNGVGSAFGKLSEFWLKMAGDTFPVIEVDAGRRIDVILSKGVAVKFMAPEELQRARQQTARTGQNQRGQTPSWFDYGATLGTMTSPTSTQATSTR